MPSPKEPWKGRHLVRYSVSSESRSAVLFRFLSSQPIMPDESSLAEELPYSPKTHLEKLRLQMPILRTWVYGLHVALHRGPHRCSVRSTIKGPGLFMALPLLFFCLSRVLYFLLPLHVGLMYFWRGSFWKHTCIRFFHLHCSRARSWLQSAYIRAT